MTWLGTPYHHQARVRGAGVDCAMFLAEVYHAAGLIPHIVPPPYPPDWHLHRDAERYLTYIIPFAEKVSRETILKPGDVATYKFGRCVSHAAIVVDWPIIIHSYTDTGVVLDHGDAPWLTERFAGGYTLWD